MALFEYARAKDLGTTSLVTTELQDLDLDGNALEEEFLVHGVIVMQTLFSGGTPMRAMQIEKMREADVNLSLAPYSISRSGIEVFPNARLFEEKRARLNSIRLGRRAERLANQDRLFSKIHCVNGSVQFADAIEERLF